MAVVDTLGIADELARDGIFSREQAERLARVDLRQAIDANGALLRSEFDARLQATAKDLVKWFAGILLAHGIAVIGVTVTLVKLL
jgi:hypothetical protein